MADAVQPALPAPKEIAVEEFAPSITVVNKKNEKLELAINAVANRADAQILASKLKKLLDKTVQNLLDAEHAPDVVTLGRLTTAAEAIVNISISAYEGKAPKDGGAGAADIAKGMLEAATRGMSQGVASAADKRAEKMAALGRAKAVEVEATAVPQ